jgi:methylthioribose-1-phosphate isomerase
LADPIDSMTDPVRPTEPAPAVAADASAGSSDVDVDRRRFFRQFAGEIASTAATMVGTVQALQRTSSELAGAILDPTRAASDDPATVPPGRAAPVDEGVLLQGAFRTSFRVDRGAIRFVDQRALPGRVVEHASSSAAEVCWAIRNEVVLGGPAIGLAAGVGLGLTAAGVRGSKPYARRATLRGAANALINTSPTHGSIRWAIDRMMAAYESLGELSEDGDTIADAMAAVGNELIGEVATEHGRLVEHGLAVVDALSRREEGPLRLLVHGQAGPLAGGQFGTALSIAIAAHHAEREVRVVVPEGRPSLAGARVTCWELDAAGVPHVLVGDAAAPALVGAGEIDAILVPADRVAANGDVAATIGTYALAAVAARRGVPFYVCAPASSLDARIETGAAITIGSRPAADLTWVHGTAVAPAGTEAVVPAHDITPRALVTAYLTASGARPSPFDAAG